MSNKTKTIMFCCFVAFCVIVLALTSFINYKGLSESSHILEESVKAQLVSTLSAAGGLIDENALLSYTDIDKIQNSYYADQLAELRQLAISTSSKYIYALKIIDGAPVFIFDTDAEDEPFTEYALAPFMVEAFEGSISVGVSNLVDEFGSYSSGAAPIMRNGKVIGIVCVDVDDTLLSQQRSSAHRNFWLMLISLTVVLALTCLLMYHLLTRVKAMQDHLAHMAHYDKLTNLPNRQYLMETLMSITGKHKKGPFALLFIDLDNFKRVNDSAGHDAGDELLQNIGHYLQHAPHHTKAFRPGPGLLNVAARIGGDEFVLIAPSIESTEDAQAFGMELIAGFSTDDISRFIEKYQVGLSVGVALYPYHTRDFNVLIKYADIAMYHAKNAGKNRCMVYDEEMEGKDEK